MPVDVSTGEVTGNATRVEVEKVKGRPGLRVRLFIDPSEKLTKESVDVETDLNVIVEKARRGVPMNVNTREPFYGDVSQIPDYATAMQIVIDVGKQFMTLPAKIRERFDNDPEKMLAFLSDERNRKEAEELGMLKAKPETSDTPAPPPAT